MFFKQFVLLVACLLVFSCNTDKHNVPTEPISQPTSKQVNFVPITFEWKAKDVDFTKLDAQLAECREMLRYIDKQLHQLDRRAYSTSFMAMNHIERAQYLETKIMVLWHIYTLSQYINLEE